jgi:hypothetical protein
LKEGKIRKRNFQKKNIEQKRRENVEKLWNKNLGLKNLSERKKEKKITVEADDVRGAVLATGRNGSSQGGACHRPPRLATGEAHGGRARWNRPPLPPCSARRGSSPLPPWCAMVASSPSALPWVALVADSRPVTAHPNPTPP